MRASRNESCILKLDSEKREINVKEKSKHELNFQEMLEVGHSCKILYSFSPYENVQKYFIFNQYKSKTKTIS